MAQESNTFTEQDEQELDSLLEEFDQSEELEQSDLNEANSDPVKKAEETGNEFWETIRNFSPTAVVDAGTPAGKLTIQAGASMADLAEGAANTVIDSLDWAENFAAEHGVGTGDLIQEGDRLKFADKIFGEPQNNVERGVRLISGYAIPFGALGKLITKGSKFVKASKAVGGAAVIETAVADPDDKRLSDIVQNVPWLSNPVTQALASDEDDSNIESRLKNTAESVLVDIGLLGTGMGLKMANGFTKSVMATRKARKAKKIYDSIKSGTKGADETVEGVGKQTGEGVSDAGPKVSVPEETTDVDIEDVSQTFDSFENGTRVSDDVVSAPGQVEGLSVRQIMDNAKKEGRRLNGEELFILAKRGRISEKAAKRAAERISASSEATEELVRRKVGASVNDEEIRALANELDVAVIRVEATLPKNLDKPTATELAAHANARERLMEVYARMEAGGSEAARALRAKRTILEEKGSSASLVNQYMKLQGGSTSLSESARMFRQALDVSNGAEVSEKLLNRKGKDIPGALYELWMNSILSGPGTHLVNILSTGFNIGSTATELAIQEGMSKFGLADDIVKGQTHAYLKGVFGSIYEGLQNGKEIMKGKIPANTIKIPDIREPKITAKGLGLDPTKSFGSFIDEAGKVIRLPGQGLMASDSFFRTLNYRGKVHVEAQRRLMELGLEPGTKKYNEQFLRIIKKPPEDISIAANEFASENVFTKPLVNSKSGQDNVFLGRAQAGAEDMLRNFPLGRLAAPFMRISGNLADYSIQRIPGVAVLSPKFKADWAAGGVRRQEAISKMILGGGVMTMGGYLSHLGVLNGEGPSDFKLKKAIDYKQDTINGFPLEKLGPYGAVLKMSADTMEMITSLDEDQEGAGDELFFGSLGILGDLFTPETLGRNIPGFFSFINDTIQGRIQEDKIQERAARLSTGLIPFSNFLRQTGRVTKGTEASDMSAEEQYNFLTGLYNQMKKEWLNTVDIFGFGNNPPRRNIFGEKVHYPTGYGTSIISTIFDNKEVKDSAVEDEILRLEMDGKVLKRGGRVENKHLNLSMPQRTIRKGMFGETFTMKLSPKEYDKYVQLSAGIGTGGPTLKERLKGLIQSKMYKSLSDERKKQLIKNTVQEMRSNARQLLMRERDIREDLRSKSRTRIESLQGIR